MENNLQLSMYLDHQNVHFIGCTHFGHSNVIRFDKRPYQNIEEHDAGLIANWNAKVKKGDIVFHLGDFTFRSSNYANQILEQLNGEIYLIAGNHDKAKEIKKFAKIKKAFFGLDLYVKDESSDDKLGNQQQIVLCHYPILSWNRQMYNSFHIHSHTHGNLTKNPDYDWYYKKKVIDVGANCVNYTPISYLDVKEIMLLKTNINPL